MPKSAHTDLSELACLKARALLKNALVGARLRKSDIARSLGITDPQVSRLFAEGSNPTVKTLGRVLEACGYGIEFRLRKLGSDAEEDLE